MKARLFFLAVILGFLPALFGDTSDAGAADGREIWLAARTDGLLGAGTTGDPFDAGTAEKFDAVLRRLPAGPLVIHLAPGRFETHGCSPWRPAGTGWAMRAGWKLRGAGPDATVVRWVPPQGRYSLPEADSRAIGIAFDPEHPESRADDAEVSDLAVDCNGLALTGFMKSSAVVLAGNASRIARVRAVNWGTLGKGECFVLGARPEGPAPLRDAVIEDCEVTAPARIRHGSGTTAIALFGCADCAVRGCFVHDIHAGGMNEPAYINGISVSGSTNADVSHNRARALGGPAVYHDTGTGSQWHIHDNDFQDVIAGVVIATDRTDAVHGVHILDNRIALRDAATPYLSGVWILCPKDSPSTDIEVRKNHIGPAGGTWKNEATGIRLSGVSRAIVANNVIDVKTPACALECHSARVRQIHAQRNQTSKGEALFPKAFDQHWKAFIVPEASRKR